MTHIAQVIVDVPTMQTDQPFTYEIPEALQAVIETGMRVEVPFGQGDRHIQGFVVGLSNVSSVDQPLKPITRLLDLSPVVNDELLQLADYMKQSTFAFKITCLQTMLPSVMKAEYQKQIVLLDENHSIRSYFPESKILSWQEAETAGLLPQLKPLRAAAVVEVQYLVKNKNKAKMIRYVKRQIDPVAIPDIVNQLRKGSTRKAALLHILSKEAYLPVSFFTENGISTAVLNQGAAEGWLTFTEVEAYRDPFKDHDFQKTRPLELNTDQVAAVSAITTAAQNKQAQTFLLEGITGSGKTEVYLQTIAQLLEQGQTAIMLVPEIALTPQMVERFKSRLGNAVAVLHSGLSQGEKYDEWRKIERGEAQVVVGARSAIFAPLKNIGVIIVDEEHEATYKQEEAPRYHARDLAIWRGAYHHCPVVLGSATPSLESRARAQKNVYQLLRLNQRAKANAQLPTIDVVDMRTEFAQKQYQTFSRLLQEKIVDRLDRKEQIVLLLNRRGYSSFVMCRDCGYVLPCPNCDISLTLHMDTKTMRCHYCGHEEHIPHRCPNCQADKIRYYGTGTQKVEEELKELFPEARVLRMDVDTTRKKGAHEKILTAFGQKKADILLGTQMIAKGLDFPDITLVGVLNADTALNLPDFRSSERTFQLLTQVSGRAGRAEKTGEVVIQTFNPEHYAIQLAQSQDYEDFYQKEMWVRHQSGYPPYFYTVKITCSHPEEQVAAQKMFAIARELKQALSPQSVLLGPAPSAILRIKNRYYYQLIIKYKHEPQLPAMLTRLLDQSQIDQRKGLYVSIDQEPLHFI
ncbi:primosomal protein N' [Enterococcus sp. DIV0876]|uniref:primosomal protein N' n=1 Tax=Enterococcus sp. DIV0876 TaxID=2774633 RepID=UPI003D3009FB